MVKDVALVLDFSLSINHIAKGSRILEAIMEFVPDMPIEDLPIPYCAVATDLVEKLKPDVLVDIQMSRYGGFDYDKSEKLIAIGRQKTLQALGKS